MLCSYKHLVSFLLNHHYKTQTNKKIPFPQKSLINKEEKIMLPILDWST